MTTTVDLGVDGPAAPPRSNGELVFAEPWEGRAFGLVMVLVDRGVLSYDDFRRRLIAEIQAWEEGHPDGEGYSYYRCWLRALEAELEAQSLVLPGDLTDRVGALAGRPAGHDHRHDDGEEHGHGH